VRAALSVAVAFYATGHIARVAQMRLIDTQCRTFRGRCARVGQNGRTDRDAVWDVRMGPMNHGVFDLLNPKLDSGWIQ